MKTKGRFHYGWVIVFSCFMIMSFYLCVVMNCPGLFLIDVTEEFGISRSQYTLNTTVVSLAMMAVALAAGKIFSKFRIKTVMTVAAVILPIGYACYSVAPNIYIFYFISRIVGLCLGLCGMVPMSTLITRWFNEKKGLATGLAFTGSGVGGMILQPIMGRLIENVGWRQTYFIIGVAMFVFVVPCVAFLIKDYPSDKGLEPVGGIKKDEKTGDNTGLTLAQAKTKSYFWLYLPMVTLASAAACSMVQQLVPYASDLGFSAIFAANLGALSLGTLAVGKILLGQIYDKIGNFKSTILGLTCLVAASFCFFAAKGAGMFYLGILISGLGLAYTTVGYPINTQTMYGKKDYSAIYGIVQCFSSIGTALGSPVTSVIFDKTGSYRTAWLFWGIINLAMIAVFITVNRLSEKEKSF